MKRKHQEYDVSPQKMPRLNPATIAFNLLGQYREALTTDLVNQAFPNLSIEIGHEILTVIKNNSRFRQPGIAVLVKFLFSHLLTHEYTNTKLSIKDTCMLLQDFQSGVILDNPALMQDFYSILDRLPVIVDYLFSTQKNHTTIDLAMVNDCLSQLVEDMTEKTTELNHLIPVIFSALNLFILQYDYIGKLNSVLLEKLFIRYQQDNPNPVSLRYMTYNLQLWTSDHPFALTDPIPAAILETGLISLAKINIDSAVGVFAKIVFDFYKENSSLNPFQAETLQVLIDGAIAHKSPIAHLPSFFFQIAHLIKNGFIHDKIENMEKILLKLPADNMDRITLTFRALTDISCMLTTPLDVAIIEKFLVFENLRVSNKNLTVAFCVIYHLEVHGKLSGVFKIDVCKFIDYVLNNKNCYSDSRLVVDTLRFLAACLNHVDPETAGELMQKCNLLLGVLTQPVSLSSLDILRIFETLRFIAGFTKFTETFNEKYLSIFVDRLLENNSRRPDFCDITCCLRALGIFARGGFIRNFPTTSLKALLNICRYSVRPDSIFRVLMAIHDLTNKDALDEKLASDYLEKQCDKLIAVIRPYEIVFQETKMRWKEYIPDFTYLSQCSDSLSAKILCGLFFFIVELLNDTSEKAAVEAVIYGLEKLSKSELPSGKLIKIDAADFNALTDTYYAITNHDPKVLLHLLVMAANLTSKGLLTGRTDYSLLMKTLMKIIPELLVSDAARYETIMRDIYDVRTVYMQFIEDEMFAPELKEDISNAIKLLMQQEPAILKQQEPIIEQSYSKAMEKYGIFMILEPVKKEAPDSGANLALKK